MPITPVDVQIQVRAGTAADWTSDNPTLALGEPGWESDTNKLKFGDGATAWETLAYSLLPISALALLQIPRVVIDIAYAATITPALPATDAIYEVGTLTGNCTVEIPSGTPVDGQTIQLSFETDGTAGRTVTFTGGADGFVFGGIVSQSNIPTSANTYFRVVAVWSARRSLWVITGIA